MEKIGGMKAYHKGFGPKRRKERRRSKGKGEREDYLDILDFRKIVLENWQIFQDVLAHGAGGKDKKTKWIEQLNSMRKIVMHPAKAQYITWDQLATLQEYDEWLVGTSTEATPS